MSAQSRFMHAPAGDDPGRIFARVISAFLVVDAALVVLLLEILDRFAIPRAPVIIAGLFAAMVSTVYVGFRMRAAAEALLTAPPSARSTNVS